MLIKLLISAFCNAVLAILLYIMEKKTSFKSVGYKAKQCIIGVLFGCMAIFSNTSLGGVDIGGGTIMNVRDAAPLCAGLIFGAPSGIIAGLIGGIYRYVAVFWGWAGEYTQLACSVSTVLAGFIAAALRKFMFDDKKPAWIYGVGVGMICEVLHMLMIFFTNMNDSTTAFALVKACTFPMVIGNGAAVGVAVLFVSLIGKEKMNFRKEQKQISQTFQLWLLVCIVIAFVATSIFTSVLQTKMSRTQAETTILTNVSDVHNDILDASDENLLEKNNQIKTEYLGYEQPTSEMLISLLKKYDVSEINVIDKNGVIIYSTYPDFINYDMASGEQSAEFLVLLNEEKEFIQKYQPVSYDTSILRKYAGLSLPDGGFIQVGYDAQQFRKDIDSQVLGAAKNRHIGNSGYMVICDEEWNIVGDNNDYLKPKIANIGISVDISTMPQDTVFEAMILDEAYYCAYSYAEGYYIVGVMPQSEALFMRDVSIHVSVFMEIIIFAALFVLIYFLIKKVIIDNIRKINNTLSEITDGNLNVTVDVRSNEEFASLSDDINSTVSTLKRYIAEAAARIDKELEFAQQIQYSSLPSAFPQRSEFELYAQMFTAKEVGGDFYDFYMLNDNTVAFLIADVSGKGIPAAMFMMRAKTIIKDLAESGMELSDIFTKANEKLCENNDAGMFVTAWMGILDLKTGIMKFANAGHNPPLIKHADDEFEYMKARSGMLLAGMEGIRYKKNEMQLMPGDRIYLYTDGVTEATDSNTELYGEDRLLEFINSCSDAGVRELCGLIKDDVDKFVGEAPQFDDITMLAVTLNCIRGDNEIAVIPNEASRETVNGFAESIISKLEVVPKIASKVNIIFDELYTNIVSYSKATLATISYNIEDGKLLMTFTDNGIAHNPLENADPDVTLSADEREIGGLGIFMVKKITESMEYAYEDNKNILKLVIALKA